MAKKIEKTKDKKKVVAKSVKKAAAKPAAKKVAVKKSASKPVKKNGAAAPAPKPKVSAKAKVKVPVAPKKPVATKTVKPAKTTAAKPAAKVSVKTTKSPGKIAVKGAEDKEKTLGRSKSGAGAGAASVAGSGVEKPVSSAKNGKSRPDQDVEFREAEEDRVPPAPLAEGEATDEELSASDEEEGEEIVLTDAEGRRYCRVKDCDQLATVDGYCRYHYLLFWKKIQIRKKILSEGKLERYIEELTARYPDKFLDMLRKDLRSEKEFLAAIQELEIDESAVEGEFEDETQTYIDEVRGMGEPSAREEEDF
ncbi:MAG: hypothetical protein AB7G93_19055 [Bdellovibrionales bacterium]